MLSVRQAALRPSWCRTPDTLLISCDLERGFTDQPLAVFFFCSVAVLVLLASAVPCFHPTSLSTEVPKSLLCCHLRRFRRHTGQPLDHLPPKNFFLSLPQTTTQCDDDDLFCCFLCQRVRTSVLWKNMATSEEGRRQVPTLKFLIFHLRIRHACLTVEATLIKVTVDLTSRTTGRMFTRDRGLGRNTQLEQATGTQREGVLEWQRWHDGAHDGRREGREEVTCHTAGTQVNQRGGSRLAGTPCQELAHNWQHIATTQRISLLCPLL